MIQFGVKAKFQQIDWTLLRKQKVSLIEVLDWMEQDDIGEESWQKDLQGILHLLDFVQDMAVDDLGLAEKEVFGNGQAATD